MAEDINTQEVTETKEAGEKNEQKIKCPCCGKTTLDKPLDIKSQVLDEYLASIMSGVSFSHTYQLYNGKLEVTVTVLEKQLSRTLLSIKQLFTDLRRCIEETDIKKESILNDITGALNLYIVIKSINTYQNGQLARSFEPAQKMAALCSDILDLQDKIYNFMNPDYKEEDKDSIFESLQALYTKYCTEASLSSIPALMLEAVAKTHSDLYDILLNSGFDENFWHGIELA